MKNAILGIILAYLLSMSGTKSKNKPTKVMKKPAPRTAAISITKAGDNQLRCRKDGRQRKFVLV